MLHVLLLFEVVPLMNVLHGVCMFLLGKESAGSPAQGSSVMWVSEGRPTMC